ncbi:MAG TPA: ATP-binding protein [Acetobacteraceae bacterium]|nr:ATP-binding protein [Acetobacteraceae bacterium]
MIRLPLPRLLQVATFRLAALYVGIFAGSAIVLGVAVFVQSRSALQQQMDARIETEAEFLLGEFKSGGIAHLAAIVRARGRGASALDYLLQGPAGHHIAGEIPSQPNLTTGWTTLDIPQAYEDGGGPERIRAFVSDLGDATMVVVGADLRQIDQLEEAIATAFVWTVGLAAALGIMGGVFLSRAFLRRVDAISRTAEAIIAGDLTQRVPSHGAGEDLDRLARTLNQMLDRIGALMDSLRQISSDVAHDLRTPLTRLYQRLEDARTHARSIADYDAAVEAAIGEAQRLLEVFSALLRIAQVEGGSARAGFAEFDLSALAETVADAYRLDAEEAGYRFAVTIDPGVTVRGDKELLTQALANLVENAVRHTPPGTQVHVRLRAGPGAVLAVEDDGPGAGETDLRRLADRFYRGERSRTTPGSGLGLSLVSAVAELHGARLVLEQGAPGFRASMVFPAVLPGRVSLPSHTTSRRASHAPAPASPASAGTGSRPAISD